MLSSLSAPPSQKSALSVNAKYHKAESFDFAIRKFLLNKSPAFFVGPVAHVLVIAHILHPYTVCKAVEFSLGHWPLCGKSAFGGYGIDMLTAVFPLFLRVESGAYYYLVHSALSSFLKDVSPLSAKRSFQSPTGQYIMHLLQ